MADLATPRPNAPPKQMSSRLLTMKFMQRATNANTAPPKAQTPASEPASKRRKTEHTSDSSGPNTPASDSKVFADRSDLKAALKAEHAYEALAASRRVELGYANNTIETQWVLDVKIPTPQHNARATEPAAEFSDNEDQDQTQEQDEDADADWAESSGRQTYGSFKRKTKSTTTQSHPQNPDFDLSSPSTDEEGELPSSSSSEAEADTKQTPSRHSHKKRNPPPHDEEDEAAAMTALDRVDLSKSRYAKAKAAGLPFTGARPRDGQQRHRRERRGDAHPKKMGGNGGRKGKNKKGRNKK